MSMPGDAAQKPTRRQFLRRTVQGVSLFGLGSIVGMASETPAPTKTRKSGRTLGKEFDYDVSKLAAVDPKLVQYRQVTAIQTGFKLIRAVATGQEDCIYGAGDKSILVWDRSGKEISRIDLGETPRCLAVGGNGSLLVGLTKQIEIYDSKHVRQSRWESLGKNAVITSIAVANGTVFVADAGNRVVLSYDLKGNPIRRIGERDVNKKNSGFVVPSPFFDLNVGADGSLYVANPGRHRVETYTADGELKSTWGQPSYSIEGFCGCCNPIHFALLPGGKFVTAEKGLPRVKVYSATGKLECVVAGPDSFPERMRNPNSNVPVCMDLAVDSTGRVLLADNQEIRIFERK